MSTQSDLSRARDFTQATEVFLALSSIYLDRTEQLSRAGLTFTRAALEDCVTASRAAGAAKRPGDPAALPFALGQSLLEHALTYGRDAFACVTGAQVEAATLLGQKFALPGAHFPVPGDWAAAVEMYSRGFRDLSAGAVASFADVYDAKWMSSPWSARQLHKAA